MVPEVPEPALLKLLQIVSIFMQEMDRIMSVDGGAYH